MLPTPTYISPIRVQDGMTSRNSRFKRNRQRDQNLRSEIWKKSNSKASDKIKFYIPKSFSSYGWMWQVYSLTFYETAYFPKCLYHSTFLPLEQQSSNCSIHLPMFGLVSLFNFSSSNRCKVGIQRKKRSMLCLYNTCNKTPKALHTSLQSA